MTAEDLLILARIWHYAAAASLAGSIAFLVFIAEPAFHGVRGVNGGAVALRHNVLRLAWASLVIALLSGALWLVCVGSGMSGQPLAAAFSRDIITTVLLHTRFGHDWLVRLALAAVLAMALVAAGRGDSLGRNARAVALVASAVFLGAIAWSGHGGATPGWTGNLHLAADVLHLLAAGAWLGGLLPLAMLFALSLNEPSLLDAARRATRRFSLLGLVSVATLIATGIVNSVFLVGSIPGLLGTPYGRLLMLKIGCFFMLVALATVNREHLTPLLIDEAASTKTLRQLWRNTLFETVLGFAVLSIVGILGIVPPAEHTEPVWPLPFRLVPAALPANGVTLLCCAGVALGLAVLTYAALHRRGRLLGTVLGIGLVIGSAWHPIAAILRPAFPTTYFSSPVADNVGVLNQGALVFAANCAICHGADARGDGPAAASLPIKPPDLIRHVPHHNPGDLYWWISNGRGGVMPSFAGMLSEEKRWDVIKFLRARAAAAQPNALLPQVTPNPAPAAPDFVFEQKGHQETLRHSLTRSALLLVLYRLPEAAARLQQLAAAEATLSQGGLRIVALPIDGAAREGGAAQPDFLASSDPATLAAYRIFEGGGSPDDCEFLIDRDAYLRARFRADRAPPPDVAQLLGAAARMTRIKLAAQPAHVHVH
ncbi:MAG TPA: copper homeostasis membrane protein CopD [Stellaceae bacterium]|nr:copper homeostasis membrane protein CopD [Stellaceae bacterium]